MLLPGGCRLIRLAISFSHGAAWKTPISRYIGTMPCSGNTSWAAEQSKSGWPPPETPVRSAMIAKIGAAARPSPSATPRKPASRRSGERPEIEMSVMAVLVVAAQPFHGEFEAALVAAPGHEIEVVISAVEHVEAPRIAGIGVEHLAGLVLVEDADPGHLRHRARPKLIVVIGPARGDLLRRERHLVIEIEIAALGRDPGEAPTHAFPVGLYPGEGRARDGGESHVAMAEVNRDAVEIVGPEGAGLAPRLPIRAEHEVIDDELGAPLEEIGEGDPARRPLEAVRLLHTLPGHRHPPTRQRIPLAREFLLGGEQLEPRLQPIFVRNDLVLHSGPSVAPPLIARARRARSNPESL